MLLLRYLLIVRRQHITTRFKRRIQLHVPTAHARATCGWLWPGLASSCWHPCSVQNRARMNHELAATDLTVLAQRTWLDGRYKKATAPDDGYDAGLVSKLYHEQLMPSSGHYKRGPTHRSGAAIGGAGVDLARPMSSRTLLEVSSYLELYLWPFFSAQASFEHVMSMIIVSTGRRSRAPASQPTILVGHVRSAQRGCTCSLSVLPS